MTTRPEAGLYLGEGTAEDHERVGPAVGLDPAELTTHGVIVGMTGSGKTGLGLVLLEEALTQGIPVLALDPKGDLGNLLLTFPSLAPEDFAPWVPADTEAATVATQWRDGLAEWGLGGADIATLRSGHPMTLYTPGSSAATPLDIIGSLAPPAVMAGASADLEAIRDEVEALVQGLLGLVGIRSDPMSGREHVLLANLVETAWAAGETLDLAMLLGRVQDPPMRKLGVIDLDSFFPPDDRRALVLKLNGLLASPSFAAWRSGQPLDIASMLWDPSGAARAAVVYLAHLSDEERQLVVTRVLSKLVAWMRAQPGTQKLRVLVYIDEVAGYAPPTEVPPSKKPILMLMKQARAFGIGMVLATQNPVDLDYKAISNAGTWMVGRLQTERDQGRLMDGLTAADGSVDTSTLATRIGGLAKREFLMHRVGKGAPSTFAVRWAMSYLAGPLTKEQLGRLPGQAQPTTPSADPPLPAADTPVAPPATDTEQPDDTSPVAPVVADGVPLRYLAASAPWASQVGATPGGTRLEAALALRCRLRFDDTKAGLDEQQEWEAIVHPLTNPIDVGAAVAVDYDDRDLVDTAPAAAGYVLADAALDVAATFANVRKDLTVWLMANRRAEVPVNRTLKLFGRPGEDDAAFAARCREAADAAADAEADKLRARLEARIDRLRDTISDAQLKAQHLQEQASTSRQSELLSGAGSVLGALFGGRRSVSSISGAVNRAATGRARTQRTKDRMEQALARVEAKEADLADLENELADEIAEIAARWDDAAAAIETLSVPLERSDVTVESVTLLWLPVL
ncbi:MAG: ATP-binding protein [Microthrixaceae bacterium]|nr:ATP-binding protein [Microthrixaceae bacterium]